MKKIKILHGKILVKRLMEAKPELNGIILPDSAQKSKIGLGEVVQGTQELPESTRIIFSNYAGTDIDLKDNNEYVILDPKDVMASYDK